MYYWDHHALGSSIVVPYACSTLFPLLSSCLNPCILIARGSGLKEFAKERWACFKWLSGWGKKWGKNGGRKRSKEGLREGIKATMSATCTPEVLVMEMVATHAERNVVRTAGQVDQAAGHYAHKNVDQASITTTVTRS